MDVVLVWFCYIWLSLFWCCIKCNQIYGINNLPLKNRSGSWVSIKNWWQKNTYFYLTFQRVLCPLMRRQILFSPSFSEEFLRFLFRDIIRSWRFTERVYPLCPHTLLGCPLIPSVLRQNHREMVIVSSQDIPAPCLHAHKPSSLFMSSRMLGILSGHLICDAVGCWLWLELFVKADN